MEDATAKESITSKVNDKDDENDAASFGDTNESLWDMALLAKEDPEVPSKSSNEILSELFGAFNAEPPKSPELSPGGTDDDGLKSKKHKKKRKKEKKHKKKSKTKRRLSDQDSSSNAGTSDTEVDELRKEKKHKRKKKRRKSSDVESNDDNEHHHHKKRSRHSRSPSVVPQTTQNGQTDEEKVIPLPAPVVEIPPVTEKESVTKVVPAFDPVHHETPSEKVKHVPGKITIKDLKFSSVYEATVKEVEEQAKAKAERYEEGEISDSSSSQKSSELSDDPVTAPSMMPEVIESVELIDKSEDPNHKRSSSKEKCSSHHKKSRHRSRSKDLESGSIEREKEKDCLNKLKDKDKSRENDKEKDKEKEKVKDKDKVKERDKDKEKEKEKEKEKKREKDREKGKHKDRERSKDRDRHRDRKDRDKDRERDRGRHRDKRHGRSRSRSPHSRRRSSSTHRRRHSRERHRSRSHSRERKRSSDHIDKKKLLEIARRNAMNMLQAGIIPANIMGRSAATAANLAVTASKPEKNAAKTVDELTEYCKELSKRENLGELSSLSGSDDSDSEKPFHHPFQVKDRPTVISLNIKNAVQLPLKSVQERTIEQSQLRMQFPVSSGQQHRKTEGEWVPVTPQKVDPPAVDKKPPPPPKTVDPVKPKPPQKDISEEIVDIGALVSQRLSVMRKMHDDEKHTSNVLDSPINQQVHGWSNHPHALPGQFTGSTGVRLLTPQQLAAGTQAWARKDQLQTATPVRSGMGMALLQKMGWKPGEGLGKNKEGCQEPLQLEVKMDRKGLVAAEEMRKRAPPPLVMPAVKVQKPAVSVEGKHPVSLLTEYCSKRHFGAPHFELCLESGPDHKKDFLFKVRVNSLEYKPDKASPNKKQAKAEAATVCLKALGVLLG